MPIYAYRCEACGHAQDVLQKLADAVLTICPSCGASAYKKQLTAAGFQLKGSGWYATDFKNAAAQPSKPADSDAQSATTPAPATPAASTPAAPAKPDGPTTPSA